VSQLAHSYCYYSDGLLLYIAVEYRQPFIIDSLGHQQPTAIAVTLKDGMICFPSLCITEHVLVLGN